VVLFRGRHPDGSDATGKLLVRAVREVSPGEEITLNYLGRSALLPMADRQDELEATYGFNCRCPRCR
jgi:hypothetical protein